MDCRALAGALTASTVCRLRPLQAAKDWPAGYFGKPVVNTGVRDLPRPGER